MSSAFQVEALRDDPFSFPFFVLFFYFFVFPFLLFFSFRYLFEFAAWFSWEISHSPHDGFLGTRFSWKEIIVLLFVFCYFLHWIFSYSWCDTISYPSIKSFSDPSYFGVKFITYVQPYCSDIHDDLRLILQLYNLFSLNCLFFFFERVVEMGGEFLPIAMARDRSWAFPLKGSGQTTQPTARDIFL